MRVIPSRIDGRGLARGRIETDFGLGDSIAIGQIPRLRSGRQNLARVTRARDRPAGQLRLA